MALEAPYPDLAELIAAIGEAGQRLSEIEASEGAAGNISVYIGWPLEPRRIFPQAETIALPEAVPELAGRLFLVTGSGRRLRDIIHDPAANLGALVVNEGGATGALYTSQRRLFARLTSEFNSHLAVHRQHIGRSGTNFHAVVHAQPVHIVHLSHIADYRDETYLNRHLLRWQPETIITLPEGLGIAPFFPPGSADLMTATLAALRDHPVVLWCKHGLVARSDQSVKRAADRIEYVETAARYEFMNLINGNRAEGLTAEEIRAIAAAFNVKQGYF